MLIACPHCATSYRVEAAAIGARGRTVRCVRCRTVWFVAAETPKPADEAAVPAGAAAGAAADTAGAGAAADADRAAADGPPAGDEAAFRSELGPLPPPPPSAAEDTPAAEPTPPLGGAKAEAAPGPDPGHADGAAASADAPAPEPPEPPSAEGEPPPAPALSEIRIPTVEAPPIAPSDPGETETREPAQTAAATEDIESVAARLRERRAARKRRMAQKNSRLPMVILALVAVVAALLAWRKDIVRHAPQMASLYAAVGLPVNLRGLVFKDVRIAHETHDGVPVLVVEGKIVSIASGPVDVPRLRFGVRNAAGAEIYAWTAVPAQSDLEPGATLPFRGRLASPPADAHDVQVRFFNRRDALEAGAR
jgi:predicted Zn finger-like uncharacterized protein